MHPTWTGGLWRNRCESGNAKAKGVCGSVKDYRLYFLDGYSGHIDAVEEFDAAGDEEAVALALARSNGRAMELWHRHHKLRHWDEALPSLD